MSSTISFLICKRASNDTLDLFVSSKKIHTVMAGYGLKRHISVWRVLAIGRNNGWLAGRSIWRLGLTGSDWRHHVCYIFSYLRASSSYLRDWWVKELHCNCIYLFIIIYTNYNNIYGRISSIIEVIPVKYNHEIILDILVD